MSEENKEILTGGQCFIFKQPTYKCEVHGEYSGFGVVSIYPAASPGTPQGEPELYCQLCYMDWIRANLKPVTEVK